MRLDKYLADMKIGTRSEVKKLVRSGRVKVNGSIVKDASLDVKDDDEVLFDEERVDYLAYEYILLHKPAGYVCALEDKRCPTVMELLESRRKDLVPVGRLDLDTEGLLLLTNDGKLQHELLSPKSHVDKKYYVETDQKIPEEATEVMKEPMDLGDFITLPAKLEIISDHSAHLTISEGKFHQVKRMFEKIGCEVTYLKRISFGPLELGDLPKGKCRELGEEEIESLKRRA